MFTICVCVLQLKGIVSDAMRELFNKALSEKQGAAKYSVNEIQKQVCITQIRWSCT